MVRNRVTMDTESENARLFGLESQQMEGESCQQQGPKGLTQSPLSHEHLGSVFHSVRPHQPGPWSCWLLEGGDEEGMKSK